MKKGKCIIFSAPSGAGKTTLVHAMLEQFPNLEFSVSACSRKIRSNEVDGKDYYFLSVSTFKEYINSGAFLEWEEVYTNNFYGTLHSEIERIWSLNHHVIFDVDVLGGLQLKKHFGERALSIFVHPPSLETLKKRLINRKTDDPEVVKKRIKKAETEMTYADQFDCIVLNDDLDNALKSARENIENFLN